MNETSAQNFTAGPTRDEPACWIAGTAPDRHCPLRSPSRRHPQRGPLRRGLRLDPLVNRRDDRRLLERRHEGVRRRAPSGLRILLAHPGHSLRRLPQHERALALVRDLHQRTRTPLVRLRRHQRPARRVFNPRRTGPAVDGRRHFGNKCLGFGARFFDSHECLWKYCLEQGFPKTARSFSFRRL